MIDVESAPIDRDDRLLRSTRDRFAVLKIARNARVRLCLCSLCSKVIRFATCCHICLLSPCSREFWFEYNDCFEEFMCFRSWEGTVCQIVQSCSHRLVALTSLLAVTAIALGKLYSSTNETEDISGTEC